VQNRPPIDHNNNNRRPPPPKDAFDQRIEILILNEQNEWQELHFSPGKNTGASQKIIKSQLVKWHGQIIARFNLIEPPPVRGGIELDFLKKQFQSIILVASLLVVICFLIAWYIAKRFAHPLKEIQKATQNIANGQFKTRLKVSRSDEIGDVMHNINMMSQSLQELEQSRRTWLAEISHELRTPLSVLQGEIEALEDGVRPFNQQSIKSLKEETLGLTRLVADLHLLALSDLHSLPCYFEEVNVLELFQTNMNKLQLHAKEKQLTCQIQLDIRESLYAYWDAQRIHQVLQNICRNAVFYTDSPGEIAVHLFFKNQSIICQIQDSAPTVDLADFNRVFEPLFRSDASRNKNSGGSGLGLAIVKAIVSAHKGKISALPSHLGGLLITFELPINSQP
jgi:two-component system sensor histidine kinase BaeS